MKVPRHPCPTSELLPAASPGQGEEPEKVDQEDLGLGQASNPLPGWEWGEGSTPPALCSPTTHLQHGSRYPAAGTRTPETNRRRSAAWRPRVPHPRRLPPPPPGFWLLTGRGRGEAGILHPRGPLGFLGALGFDERIFWQFEESSYREMAERPRRGRRIWGAQRPGPGT